MRFLVASVSPAFSGDMAAIYLVIDTQYPSAGAPPTAIAKCRNENEAAMVANALNGAGQ